MQFQTKVSEWMRTETFEAFANTLGKQGYRLVSVQHQEKDTRGIFQREVNLPDEAAPGEPRDLTEGRPGVPGDM